MNGRISCRLQWIYLHFSSQTPWIASKTHKFRFDATPDQAMNCSGDFFLTNSQILTQWGQLRDAAQMNKLEFSLNERGYTFFLLFYFSHIPIHIYSFSNAPMSSRTTFSIFLLLFFLLFCKCGSCAILMIETAANLSRNGSFLLPLPFNVIGQA